MSDGAIIKHVKIGELIVGKPPDILKVTLGSCVGIAFLWKKKRLYGLAHCLLPDAPEKNFLIGAKYVSQAIPSMISLMRLKREDVPDVEIHMAGGSNMTELRLVKTRGPHIGEQNINTAKRILHELGFKIFRCETGNSCAMQIEVNCHTENVEIIKIIGSKKIQVG